LFLNPSAKAQVDAIFALPNIERIELMSSITTLPKAASNVQYLSVETPDVEAIKHYAHLHTLDLWTKTTDRNVLRSISGLELKKLTVLQSTTYPKLSEGGLFGTYWAKDLPDFWASFN
jgi:Fe-S cluster assembly ATPase SufC